MFRSLTAFVLIAALITSNFSQLFVYAGFEMNRNYIAARLCENRAKPMMHCNGKCYLAKKIKQAAEKEKNEERQSLKSQFQEAFIGQDTRIVFSSFVLQVIKTPYILSPSFQQAADIFQPPQAFSVS
ncbi:MAG: hypothetical protein EOP47_25115 [Sphingobacteriaceae bacterium]|nr:MAG: hypothetical protein EOP47_25115 [Sphingobacteriaceae bacterium]